MTETKMKVVLLLILSALLLSACTVENRKCLRSHTETYYSTQGTSLWIATKNAGFLAQNGYKNREVCDEWETK